MAGFQQGGIGGGDGKCGTGRMAGDGFAYLDSLNPYKVARGDQGGHQQAPQVAQPQFLIRQTAWPCEASRPRSVI
jgi:hypothetical protein